MTKRRMTARRAAAGLVVATAIALGAAACGDDDGSDAAPDDTGTSTSLADDGGTTHTRDDYVALIGGGGEGLTDEEGDCIAAAVVDTVGVDALDQAGAWDELQADPEASLADIGVEVDEAQIDLIADGTGDCLDVRQFFEMTFAEGEGLSPELAACLASGVDEDTLQRSVAVAIAHGEAALDADADVTAEIEDAALDCANRGIS